MREECGVPPAKKQQELNIKEALIFFLFLKKFEPIALLDFGLNSLCVEVAGLLCTAVRLGPVWGKANILHFISWVSCEVGLLLQAQTIKTYATEMWRELGSGSWEMPNPNFAILFPLW